MATPPHPRLRSPSACWLALASVGLSCVGTPTGEPPDELPRPDFGERNSVRVVDAAAETTVRDLPMSAPAGSVRPETDVWIVNLDEPSVAPITVRAAADGSFVATARGRIGQRLRLVSRTADRHSLPLDVTAVSSGPYLGYARIELTSSCFSIEPREELSLDVDPNSTRQRFVLENRCAGEVAIGRAELRFGDQGFRLTTPPSSVPANGRAELNLLFPVHADPQERADLLLLEATVEGVQQRYVLGIWSGTGKD